MIEEQRLKIDIEIMVVGDGRTFINYWNYIDGDDVICELIDGKLFIESKEISIQEFVDSVKSKY